MSTKRPRTKCTTSGSDSALRKALLYRGLLSRVAETLGVSRQHVSQVARGIRSSRRVTAALLQEIQRIDKEAA